MNLPKRKIIGGVVVETVKSTNGGYGFRTFVGGVEVAYAVSAPQAWGEHAVAVRVVEATRRSIEHRRKLEAAGE